MKGSIGLDKSASTTKANKLLIGITPQYNKEFWLYIAIDIDCTLKDLDQFLRDVWVECCGHLSMFRINGKNYESEVDEDCGWGKHINDMNMKLKDVVSVNDKIQYEYDFGSTTYLELKVVDELICSKKGKKIEIVARNNEPKLSCSDCDKSAEYYDYENEKYLCANCSENYAEDSEMIEELGYINSPRAGVCGYQGEKEDEVKYLPNTNNEKVIELRNFLEVKEEECDDKLHFEDDELRLAVDKLAKQVMGGAVRRELKNWRPTEKKFSLEYHLSRFTKDELLTVARNFYIEKVSSLKKDEIKNRIIGLYEERVEFLIENIDVERFKLLLYTAGEGICRISDDNIQMNTIYYFRDRACIFTGTVDGEEIIIMPQELQKIVLNKNKEDFIKQLEKNEELIKLFWGMCYYYGVVELDVFKELVKKYIDFDISNINLKAVLKDGADHYQEFDFNGYLGSDIIVDDIASIFSEQKRRADLKFYPFKKEELLTAAQIDFYEKTKAYKKLYDFFTSNFDMNGDEAEDLIFSVEAEIKNDKNLNDIVSELLGNFEVSGIDEVNFIANEVFKFANNTRQWVIKGYTPEELNPLRIIKGERIGRNDLCPCGSGKKYKKCCGK